MKNLANVNEVKEVWEDEKLDADLLDEFIEKINNIDISTISVKNGLLTNSDTYKVQSVLQEYDVDNYFSELQVIDI